MIAARRPRAEEHLDLPGEEIPLEDDAADTVLVTYTLCTIPDVMRALSGMRRVLKPDGFLFLGGSETTIGLDDGFERVAVGNATVYRPRGADPLETPLPETAGAGNLGAVVGRVSFPVPQPFGAAAAAAVAQARPVPVANGSTSPAAGGAGSWPWLSQSPAPPGPSRQPLN